MKHTLIVDNIKCGGCSNRIEQKVAELEGVSNVAIDIDSGSVSFDSSSKDLITKVESLLKSMGYPKAGEGGTLDSAKSYVSCMIGRVTK